MRARFWGSAGRTIFKMCFFCSLSSSFLISLCASFASVCAHSCASSRRKMDPFCHAWASDVKYVSVAPGPRKSLNFLAVLRDRVSVWNVDGPSSSLRMGLLRAPLPGHTNTDRFEILSGSSYECNYEYSYTHTHIHTRNFIEIDVLIFSTNMEGISYD